MSPRARWLEQRDESRWRAAGLAPLYPASWLYGVGTRLHRASYHRGWLRATPLPISVVSVGNLVAGGTGKTPTAAWIARSLHRRGHKVAIATRGYARRTRAAGSDAVLAVSDGRHVHARAEIAGDEPWTLAAHAPGIPVLVGSDRVRVGLRAFSAFGTEVIVLDDGFQHHRLHRDVEVITVDGGFGFGNGHLLPRGPLREPLSALRFADAIFVVDGPLVASDAARLDERAPNAHRFAARRRPLALRSLRGGPSQSPEALDGATLGMICGLARPAALRHTLEQLGAVIVAERTFRDHHRYRPRDVANLRDEAPLWITTEKDAVKITPDWVRGADVRVLSIELEVAESGSFLDWLEARLQ